MSLIMKVALGNLGPITYALKISLESLGVEVYQSLPNSESIHLLAQKYLPPELCHPLKMLLGNYLYNIEHKPDAVIFFSGCDMCNMSPINYSYKEIFNDLGWYPEPYFCTITSKKDFVLSYLNVLKKLSGKSWLEIAPSIYLGFKLFESFNFLDQVFYQLRPLFGDHLYVKNLYNDYFSRLANAVSNKDIEKITGELNDFYIKNKVKINDSFLRVGLLGDVYTLAEPFLHQNVDEQLGNMGIIVDRWSKHCLLSKKDLSIQDKPSIKSEKIDNIFRNQYGVFTSLEILKLKRYVARGYDGIVFLSPLECNPNDALRNYLSIVQEQLEIPLMSLVFDEHSNKIAVTARLEAFVDLLHKRKRLLSLK
ncbi:MAG: hypothetical protein AB7V50_06915 [Vampirovibrionia bacterium]